MKKKIQKILGMLFVCIMLVGMSTTVYATTNEPILPQLPILEKYNENNHTNIKVLKNYNKTSTYAWPGSGSAAQVTNVSLYTYGWLTNGHFITK